MLKLSTSKVPSEEMSLTNRAFINPREYNEKLKYSYIHTGVGSYAIRIDPCNDIPAGKIAFGFAQRKWANLSLDQKVDVQAYQPHDYLGSILLSVEMHNKKILHKDPLNTDEMSVLFSQIFSDAPLTVGQCILFKFGNLLLFVTVKQLSLLQKPSDSGDKNCTTGLALGNTIVVWERQASCSLLLIGKAASSIGDGHFSIISPNWDFAELGIGGLDKEFSAIFRRTFASRMFPPQVAQQLGLKHVRGILLYGPPGTGKTLMARQIGNMLNARPPKIVNGPSILDKYVGESEANIRKLFADAEEEEKRLGAYSALHIIIFDEIDAICKSRGSVGGGAAVHDTVVNQLLTKMDGVDQLNNVLVIGMTNRRDMIDEALLRPGRFEMLLEISLPDEDGRLQILEIHTDKMAKSNKLAPDVSLRELARRTKNFSGAEIEGLCRAAAFTAMYQLVKPTGKDKLDPDAFEKLLVKRSDFVYSLENDIKPMFGTAEEELSHYAPRGIMMWGEPVTRTLEMGQLAVRAVSQSEVETYRPLTLLLEGPPKSGKTALAVEIARRSDFPFVKIVTSHRMIGFTETAKCAAMKKIFDDAAKSLLSVVIIDNVEGLIEYNPVGPRFSNYIVQAIRDLVSQPLPAGRRMLVLATTSCREALSDQNLTQAFSWHVHVSMMTSATHVVAALEEDDRLTSEERTKIEKSLANQKLSVGIKHLIDLLDLVTKMELEYRVAAFLSRLEDDMLV